MITPLPFVVAVVRRREIDVLITHEKMRLRQSPWLARLVIGKKKS